jgi:hypothetical protein
MLQAQLYKMVRIIFHALYHRLHPNFQFYHGHHISLDSRARMNSGNLLKKLALLVLF